MLQGRRVVLRDIFTQVLSSIIERETHHTRYMCVQDHYRILGTKEHLNMNVSICMTCLPIYSHTYLFLQFNPIF